MTMLLRCVYKINMIMTRTWTLFDDLYLIHLYEQKGYGWKEIAKYFPGKSQTACEKHYSNIRERDQAGPIVLPPIDSRRRKMPLRRLKKLLYRIEVFRN